MFGKKQGTIWIPCLLLMIIAIIITTNLLASEAGKIDRSAYDEPLHPERFDAMIDFRKYVKPPKTFTTRFSYWEENAEDDNDDDDDPLAFDFFSVDHVRQKSYYSSGTDRLLRNRLRKRLERRSLAGDRAALDELEALHIAEEKRRVAAGGTNTWEKPAIVPLGSIQSQLQRAYAYIFTRLKRMESKFILYPYGFSYNGVDGLNGTFPDGAVISTKPDDLPQEGYFSYMKANSNLQFGRSKALYDGNIAILKIESKFNGKDMDLTYESDNFCSVFALYLQKTKQCLRGSDFNKYRSPTSSFVVFINSTDILNGTLMIDQYTPQFSLLIIPDIVVGSEDAIVDAITPAGAEKIRDFVRKGGMIYTSVKGVLIAEKLNLLTQGTVNTGYTLVAKQNIAATSGCESNAPPVGGSESSFADFARRMMCFSIPNGKDGLKYNYLISSYLLNKDVDRDLIPLVSFNQSASVLNKRNTVTGLSEALSNNAFLPMVLYKQYYKGQIIVNLAQSVFKAQYYPWFVNAAFLSYAQNTIFDSVIWIGENNTRNTPDLTIPGLEENIILRIDMEVVNLFDDAVQDIEMFAYLPKFVVAVDDKAPTGCKWVVAENGTEPPRDDLNSSGFWNCSMTKVEPYSRKMFTFTVEITDATVTQKRYNILMLYPTLKVTETRTMRRFSYEPGGVMINAKLAALIRSGLNPDPSSFYPIKGQGQYVDNVLYAENKEDSEAIEVEHVTVVPIVSPVVDGDDQAAMIRTMAFLDSYYKQSVNGMMDYHYPFRDKSQFDYLDFQYFAEKDIILNADWDTPVKTFKVDRIGFPDFSENITSDYPDNIKLVNYSTNVGNYKTVTKQMFFPDADRYFEHATQRQLVFTDINKPNGAAAKFPNGIPHNLVSASNPNIAKTEYVFVRNDIYLYDTPNYPLIEGLNSYRYIISIDRYPNQRTDYYSPNCTVPFGSVRSYRTFNGYFDDTKPGGLLPNEWSNELVMNCDRQFLHYDNVETASEGKIKKVHYLVPLIDPRVQVAGDLLDFDPVTGEYDGYPEIKFIMAHGTTFLLDPAITRKGGRLDFHFPSYVKFRTNGGDPASEGLISYSADKVAFTKTTYNAKDNVVSAFFKRGHMPDEQYGQPSVLTVNFENLYDTRSSPSNLSTIEIQMFVYEMKYDLSMGPENNYERYIYRDNSTRNATLGPYLSLPAVRVVFKLRRNLNPYEYLEPFVRYGVYIQEVLKHRTVWGSAESHHPSDPGLTSPSAGFSTISNIGISSIPFREYLTTGSRQMIPSVTETSRVQWKDIWQRTWAQPVRSVFPDVPPIPPPLRNFMMTTTFEITRKLTGERVLNWPSDEELDIRVHLKLLNNYPKWFRMTGCKDNEIQIVTPPELPLNDSYTMLRLSNNRNYGICFSENEQGKPPVTLSGQVLNNQQLEDIKKALLCTTKLREMNCTFLEGIPTVSRRSTGPPPVIWNYSPQVENYWPQNYIKDNMWDLTHYDYDDNWFGKGYDYHMDNLLPQLDTSILRPHNIIAQPIWKGFGYKIEYDKNHEVPRFPGLRGWWSPNLQNRDHTLVAGQERVNDVAVGMSDLIEPSQWIDITELRNVSDIVDRKLGNIYVCLFNRHTVKVDPQGKKAAYLPNVLQNNVVPIDPTLTKYDTRLTQFDCSKYKFQYSPENISQFDNIVLTQSARDWLYFGANLRGNAKEAINVVYKLSPFSDTPYEGFAKVADGGRFVYWNPANGPNSFLMVDNEVNVVQAKRNDIVLDTQLLPVSITTFDTTLYHLIYLSDEAERNRQFWSKIWIDHYGFGDSAVSVYVGEAGTTCWLDAPGKYTIAKITFFNNCGFDWNLIGRAIDSVELEKKPISANDLLFRLVHSIQVPTKYNFMTVHVPPELEPYLDIRPSDHNIEVAPMFFDFQDINVANIRDGFKGEYFYRITLRNDTAESMPETLRGKLWYLNVTLNYQYFDKLPNYNSPAKPGYHDYTLQIPPIVIAIPHSNNVSPSWYAGRVFYTSGYSSDLIMEHEVPSIFEIQGAKYVPEESVDSLYAMSLNEENKYQLLENFFNSLTKTVSGLTIERGLEYSKLNFDLSKDFPRFPLPFENSTKPDQATAYILLKTHAPSVPYGWILGAWDSSLHYKDFTNKQKHSGVRSPPSNPGNRYVYAKGAYISVQYEGYLVDEDTLNPLYDQNVHPDRNQTLRLIAKVLNEGSDMAYNVNVTFKIPTDLSILTSQLMKDGFDFEMKPRYNDSRYPGKQFQIISILTHTHLPPGEIMAVSIYLKCNAIINNNSTNPERGGGGGDGNDPIDNRPKEKLFIKGMEVMVDLTAGAPRGKGAVQYLDKELKLPYIWDDQGANRESVSLDLEVLSEDGINSVVKLTAHTESKDVDIIFYYRGYYVKVIGDNNSTSNSTTTTTNNNNNDDEIVIDEQWSEWVCLGLSPNKTFYIDVMPVSCNAFVGCRTRREYVAAIARGSMITYDNNGDVTYLPLIVAQSDVSKYNFTAISKIWYLLLIPMMPLTFFILLSMCALLAFFIWKNYRDSKRFVGKQDSKTENELAQPFAFETSCVEEVIYETQPQPKPQQLQQQQSKPQNKPPVLNPSLIPPPLPSRLRPSAINTSSSSFPPPPQSTITTIAQSQPSPSSSSSSKPQSPQRQREASIFNDIMLNEQEGQLHLPQRELPTIPTVVQTRKPTFYVPQPVVSHDVVMKELSEKVSVIREKLPESAEIVLPPQYRTEGTVIFGKERKQEAPPAWPLPPNLNEEPHPIQPTVDPEDIARVEAMKLVTNPKMT